MGNGKGRPDLVPRLLQPYQYIPLSEIVDYIDKVVVDGGGKIVVKWNIK